MDIKYIGMDVHKGSDCHRSDGRPLDLVRRPVQVRVRVLKRGGRIVCSKEMKRLWHPLAEPGRCRRTRSSCR
jgi:hypothetical protein